MTLSVLDSKWKVHLAFILICQTTRRIEGHPTSSTLIPNATKQQNISVLINDAYEHNELLRPEQWMLQNENGGRVTRPTQRDTSKHPYYPNDETSVSSKSHHGQRKLLEVSSTDGSIHSEEDGKIIFPDSKVPIVRPISTCHNSTFCENVPDYPKDLVNAAIAQNFSLRFLGSIDPISDIEYKIDADDETPLCQYNEHVVFPQTAKNKEQQWLYVVNQDNLKQGIRIEVCRNEGQKCNMINGFAEGYTTTCTQKYIYRELTALASNGNVIKDQFRFPSSCCCHVKFIGDPHVRLGFGLQFNQTTAIPKARKRK